MEGILKFSYSALILFLFSSNCTVEKSGKYGYFSTDKEWEIQIEINSDYSFTIEDKYGCNQLKQSGTWKVIEKGYDQIVVVLEDNKTKINKGTNLNGKEVISYFDNSTNAYYQNPIENQFPLIRSDTIYIKGNELKLKGYIFTKNLNDLRNKRILEIEKSYIQDLGKEKYIQLLGDGVSIERARDNLKKCR